MFCLFVTASFFCFFFFFASLREKKSQIYSLAHHQQEKLYKLKRRQKFRLVFENNPAQINMSCQYRWKHKKLRLITISFHTRACEFGSIFWAVSEMLKRQIFVDFCVALERFEMIKIAQFFHQTTFSVDCCAMWTTQSRTHIEFEWCVSAESKEKNEIFFRQFVYSSCVFSLRIFWQITKKTASQLSHLGAQVPSVNWVYRLIINDIIEIRNRVNQILSCWKGEKNTNKIVNSRFWWIVFSIRSSHISFHFFIPTAQERECHWQTVLFGWKYASDRKVNTNPYLKKKQRFVYKKEEKLAKFTCYTETRLIAPPQVEWFSKTIFVSV